MRLECRTVSLCEFTFNGLHSVGNPLLRFSDHGIDIVCSTGSGGRLDPARIEVADLSQTDVDALARVVRKILRRDYGFPGEKEGPFGIAAVFSREEPSAPRAMSYDRGKGPCCLCARRNNEFMSCDDRNLILGTAAFVTGAFGLHCAAVAVRALLQPAEGPAHTRKSPATPAARKQPRAPRKET